MTESNKSPATGEPGVFYVAVAALPQRFDAIAEWVEVVLREHPHMLGMRALIDCSRLSTDATPPSVEYLSRLAVVLAPLMRAAPRTRCAILVPQQPLLWRARLFESMTSDSRIAFRAFESVVEATAWLRDPDSDERRGGARASRRP